MARSLFLFDMTFWLYLAALGLRRIPLCEAPLAAVGPGGASGDGLRRPRRRVGYPVRTGRHLVTIFGWVMNTLALTTRRIERMEHSGTFAPWSNQFEAMPYVSWAIILGLRAPGIALWHQGRRRLRGRDWVHCDGGRVTAALSVSDSGASGAGPE